MQISALQLVGSCIRTSCLLHIFLEFGRGNSRIILELTAEKAQIVISAYLGNVRHGKIFIHTITRKYIST